MKAQNLGIKLPYFILCGSNRKHCQEKKWIHSHTHKYVCRDHKFMKNVVRKKKGQQKIVYIVLCEKKKKKMDTE